MKHTLREETFMGRLKLRKSDPQNVLKYKSHKVYFIAYLVVNGVKALRKSQWNRIHGFSLKSESLFSPKTLFFYFCESRLTSFCAFLNLRNFFP